MTTHSAPPIAPVPVAPAQVLELFTRLLALQPLTPWRTRRKGFAYARIWTPLITLWYLLWQRLQDDLTLDAVVQDAHDGGADALTPGPRPLSQRLRSAATAAFSKARARQPLRWLRHAFDHLTARLRQDAPNLLWHGREVCLIDGSTIRLRPHGNIPKRFAPAANQQGPAYWCLVRVVVGFCATSGLALVTGLGPQTVSEQTLAVALLLRGTAGRIWVGDRNFGLWRLARAAVQTQSHLLVRLTERRAAKLLGRALHAGLDVAVQWTPSAHDQCDPGLERQPVAGRLLCVEVRHPGFRTQTLYLFTTLTEAAQYSATDLLALYGVRWHAELNLRYLKTQMRLAQLDVKSARLAIQQWYAGLLTYNLIRGVILWAGALAGVSPLELSFARARRRICAALEVWQAEADPARRAARWERLLKSVAAARQARRRRPRPSEPRAKRQVRETFPPLRGSRAAARQELVETTLKS